MVRSQIAQALLGMSAKETREYDFPSAKSRRDIFFCRGVPIRSSVRMVAGMLTGPSDLDEERNKVEDFIPPHIRARK